MAEKLILLNVEMVRATLDRQKTQTRRPVKNQGEMQDAPRRFDAYSFNPTPDLYGEATAFGFQNEHSQWKSPFGKPGDTFESRTVKRVWVERVQNISGDDAKRYINTIIEAACQSAKKLDEPLKSENG